MAKSAERREPVRPARFAPSGSGRRDESTSDGLTRDAVDSGVRRRWRGSLDGTLLTRWPTSSSSARRMTAASMRSRASARCVSRASRRERRPLRRAGEAGASPAAGSGGRLRWAARELTLRPASHWRERYSLADRDRELVILDGKGWGRRPVKVTVADAGAIEPGLLLFAAFVVRGLAEDAGGATAATHSGT
jgi:hypothetical protein